MNSDGTISWDNFLNGCENFVKMTNDWSLVSVMDIPGAKYLRNSCWRTFSEMTRENGHRDDDGDSSESSLENMAVEQECHIVYSLSHSVPVLYFNISFMDGKLCSLEQILSCLKINLDEENALKQNIICQQEHPILHCPYFTLHPCHTHTIMKTLSIQSKSSSSDEDADHLTNPNLNLTYFLSWLSIVSSRLGFPMSGIELDKYLKKLNYL